MQIVLDTNILLVPGRYKTDVFELCLAYGEPVLLEPCLHELEKLAKKGGKTGFYARIGINLLEKKGLKDVKCKIKEADRAITDYAIKNKCMVATNDKALINVLRRNNIMVLRLRQKKFLEMS